MDQAFQISYKVLLEIQKLWPFPPDRITFFVFLELCAVEGDDFAEHLIWNMVKTN